MECDAAMGSGNTSLAYRVRQKLQAILKELSDSIPTKLTFDKTSFVEGSAFYQLEYESERDLSVTFKQIKEESNIERTDTELTSEGKEDDVNLSVSETKLSKHLTDSLELVLSRQSKSNEQGRDRVHQKKYCPMEKCKLMHMDSFIRSLPPYMKANPFTHFESAYENYEACTPEQIEILKKRIEEKKKKNRNLRTKAENYLSEHPTDEWDEVSSVDGVGVQTSELSMDDGLGPCTCRAPPASEVSSDRVIFTVDGLVPTKMMMNEIQKKCFFDEDIEFKRFKVLGQDDSTSTITRPPFSSALRDPHVTAKKLAAIREVLQKHPSLAMLFQHV